MTCDCQRTLDLVLLAVGGMTESLRELHRKADDTVTALDSLKQADADLKTEVATFLTDIATRLSGDDPDIQAIADDIEGQVAALQGGDPETGAAPPVSAPPATAADPDPGTPAGS